MKRLLAFCILSATVLSSCNFFDKKVVGDGNVTTQARSVDNFSGVDISGAISVYLTQSDAYSVKVEIDNNLQEYIDVYRDGDMLRIHQKNNTSLQTTNKEIKVYVSAPDFRKLEASGACNYHTQSRISTTGKLDIHLTGACEADLDVKAPDIYIDASGASTAKLRGETKDLKIDGSGAFNIRSFDLLAENVNIDISGAGNAEIFASQKIDAEASGASEIRYKGTTTVNINSSGASTVRKMD